MQAHNTNALRRRVVRPLIAAIAAAASCGAWADEPSPYYIGVTQSLTHDSNVYRVSDTYFDTTLAPLGRTRADNYSNTGLIGGFDQLISRQRVYANLNLHYNKYQDNSTLNNTSYGVSAGWDWATIENLSGNLSLDANQSLAALNGNALVPVTTRNLVKTDQLSTSVRWGGEGLLNLTGSYAHSRVKYSAPEYLSSQSSGDTGSIGANFRLGPDLRVGGALRFTRTVSPYGVALTQVLPPSTDPADYASNTTSGRNVDLTLDWRSTAQTNLNARLSWTHQSNSNSGASSLDFSGLTGAITANYAPTAKLTFGAGISRDAGTNSSFFNTPTSTPGTPVSGLSQNSQTTDAYSLRAGYAATAKISLNANLQYRRSRIVNSPANDESTDDTRSASLGASYEIARSLQLGCNLSHESHSLSGIAGYSYGANTVGCSAQFTLR